MVSRGKHRIRRLEVALYVATMGIALALPRRLPQDPNTPGLRLPSLIVGIAYTGSGVELLRRSRAQASSGKRMGLLVLSALLLVVGLSNLTRSRMKVIRSLIWLPALVKNVRGLFQALYAYREDVRAQYGDRFDALHDTLRAFMVDRDPLAVALRKPDFDADIGDFYEMHILHILQGIHGLDSPQEIRKAIFDYLSGLAPAFAKISHPTQIGTESEYSDIAEELWQVMNDA